MLIKMKWKHTFLFGLFLLVNIFCQSQKINFKISDIGSGIKLIEIITENVILIVDQRGNISSVSSVTGGDFDYWTGGYGNDRQGKIKAIGNLEIDYWTSAYGSERQGKVKSIGNLAIDYWTSAYGNERQ